MAFASSDGMYLQSISVLTEAALEAVETSDLVDGDIAFVDADFIPGGETRGWWTLRKDSTATKPDADTLYTKNSNSGALHGRWLRLTIATDP